WGVDRPANCVADRSLGAKKPCPGTDERHGCPATVKGARAVKKRCHREVAPRPREDCASLGTQGSRSSRPTRGHYSGAILIGVGEDCYAAFAPASQPGR